MNCLCYNLWPKKHQVPSRRYSLLPKISKRLSSRKICLFKVLQTSPYYQGGPYSAYAFRNIKSGNERIKFSWILIDFGKLFREKKVFHEVTSQQFSNTELLCRCLLQNQFCLSAKWPLVYLQRFFTETWMSSF